MRIPGHLGLGSELADVLGRACAAARDLALGLADPAGGDLDRRRNMPGAASRVVINPASSVARHLCFPSAQARDLGGVPGQSSRCDALARRLGRWVALAAAVPLATPARLPATGRPWYAEEHRSELADQAQSGAGRRHQLLFAFRQLSSAVPAACALRSSRQRSAAP
jgi:hypothetical protein